MKIKLSQKQWQDIGKKAGWIKESLHGDNDDGLNPNIKRQIQDEQYRKNIEWRNEMDKKRKMQRMHERTVKGKEEKYLKILEFDGQKMFDKSLDLIVDPTGYVRNISPQRYEDAIKRFFGGDLSKLDPKLQKAIEMTIMQHADNVQEKPV
jgi:hypothetical protein